MKQIDGDALKAKFCNHCDERDCKPDATGTVYGCVIADTIDSMPTIKAEPDNGWISVDDRLPEVFKNVLTIDSEGKIFINWLEDIIEMKGYFAYGGGSVTHWRYLPEPPKGE